QQGLAVQVIARLRRLFEIDGPAGYDRPRRSWIDLPFDISTFSQAFENISCSRGLSWRPRGRQRRDRLAGLRRLQVVDLGRSVGHLRLTESSGRIVPAQICRHARNSDLGERYSAIYSAYPHWLSAVDNPLHDHIRLVVNQVWTPTQVEKRRPRVRQ